MTEEWRAYGLPPMPYYPHRAVWSEENGGEKRSFPLHEVSPGVWSTGPIPGIEIETKETEVSAYADAVDKEIARLQKKVENRARKSLVDARTIRRLRLEKEKLEVPPEPDKSIQAIGFVKIFANQPSVRYRYAATRDEDIGRWWVTGRRAPQGLTWRQLVAFMREDNAAPRVMYCDLVVGEDHYLERLS